MQSRATVYRVTEEERLSPRSAGTSCAWASPRTRGEDGAQHVAVEAAGETRAEPTNPRAPRSAFNRLGRVPRPRAFETRRSPGKLLAKASISMVELNHRDRTIKVKIVYYGPALGGKTTNLQVIHRHADAHRRGEMVSINSAQDRTILFDLLPLKASGFRGFDLRLQILAVPGQAMYAATRRLVLKGADALVFVANSAVDRWEENLQSYREMTQNLLTHHLDPSSMPLVFQYNKRDLPQVSETELLDRALNGRKADSIPAVAVKGEGVLETFSAILMRTIQDLSKRYSILETRDGQPAWQWTQQTVLGMFGTNSLGAETVLAEEPAPPAAPPKPVFTVPPAGAPTARPSAVPRAPDPVAPPPPVPAPPPLAKPAGPAFFIAPPTTPPTSSRFPQVHALPPPPSVPRRRPFLLRPRARWFGSPRSPKTRPGRPARGRMRVPTRPWSSRMPRRPRSSARR